MPNFYNFEKAFYHSKNYSGLNMNLQTLSGVQSIRKGGGDFSYLENSGDFTPKRKNAEIAEKKA